MDDLTLFVEYFSDGTLLSPMLITALMILIFGICLFVFAGSAGYLTTILTIAASAYPIARAKSIGNPFIREEHLDELLEGGMVHDVLARIQATGFFLLKSNENESSDRELMLEKKEMEEYQAFLSSVPSDFTPFFDGYKTLYEIRMIKRIIRMIHQGHTKEDIKRRVLPVGLMTDDLIFRMAESTCLDDSLHLLSDTPYKFLVSDPLETYHKQGLLIPLEISLDQYGAEKLSSSSSLIRTHLVAPFRDFVSILADISNIRTLIRGKHAGLSQSFISSCFLSQGLKIPPWRLIQLNEMMSVPDVISQLSGTAYDQLLMPVLSQYPGPGSLIQFDLALDKFLLQTLSRISLVYYFTGGPLIRFMLVKEYEYRNIQVILAGLEEGVDTQTIRSLLVYDTVAG